MTTETSNARGPDVGMALHWIERYASGFDTECQIDRVAHALGVTLPEDYAAAPPPAAARGDVRVLVALAEQMERDADVCRRDGYIDAAVVKEDCAQRIRQTLGISAIAEAIAAEGVQAGEVSAEDVAVLHRLKAALPDVGVNGWYEGVQALDRVLSSLSQQPAAAEPKTLPVPTRVHLIGETAVIVGTPGRGWDEEGPDAHNCDAMGCATIGPHVLARVPFTDERALTAAQQQGQAVAWMTPESIAHLAKQSGPAKVDAWNCSSGTERVPVYPQPMQQGGGEVWQPMATAPTNGAGILALLPDSNFPVGVRYHDGGWHVAWDGSRLGEFDQPRKWMRIPDEYERTAPPSAPVGVDAPGSRAWMAEVCRAAALSLAAHGVRNDQLSKVADWITQQPAAVAVDEAMVERACKAALDEVWPDTYEDADDLRAMIRRILSAALAAQHQEPTT